jgi:hypothetical protein
MRSGPSNHLGGPSHSQPPHPQPPNLGTGQSGIFGSIMTNPGGPGPGLAPPPDQPQGHPQHTIPQPPQQPFSYAQPQPVNGGK